MTTPLTSLRAAAVRKALASAAVAHTPGELKLLELSGRRWARAHADNTNASSRALVERLAGHAGIGASSRTAVLTVVSK